MIGRTERLLIVLAPVAAMAAVALGLRIGAGKAVRAAVVTGAPASGAGTGLAWQLSAYDEERGLREAAVLPDVEVVARADGQEARWRGPTNEDGAAEMLLPLPEGPVSLEVRAGKALLARGDAAAPAPVSRPAPGPAWARFARREGALLLDVAVLGQRVGSGFPASIWVRATDGATHAPLTGVAVTPESDASFATATPTTTTDARGWAHVLATPMGHAVAMLLHARAPDGRTGEWDGGLFVSPGAAQLTADDRYAPDQGPVLDVVVPTMRTTAYVEIDDARGRAWAAAVPLIPSPGAMPHATVRAPRLAPGLYWAVAADDPAGASQLGPGTIVRPFFVAASDQAALAMGLERDECAARLDPRETPRALSVCLALAGATPVPRWTAIEGFTMQHARDSERRRLGLGVGLGAILLAVLLEAVLLLRAAVLSRARLRAAASEEGDGEVVPVARVWNIGVSVLVALLGFALLAAFLARLD